MFKPKEIPAMRSLAATNKPHPMAREWRPTATNKPRPMARESRPAAVGVNNRDEKTEYEARLGHYAYNEKWGRMSYERGSDYSFEHIRKRCDSRHERIDAEEYTVEIRGDGVRTRYNSSSGGVLNQGLYVEGSEPTNEVKTELSSSFHQNIKLSLSSENKVSTVDSTIKNPITVTRFIRRISWLYTSDIRIDLSRVVSETNKGRELYVELELEWIGQNKVDAYERGALIKPAMDLLSHLELPYIPVTIDERNDIGILVSKYSFNNSVLTLPTTHATITTSDYITYKADGVRLYLVGLKTGLFTIDPKNTHRIHKISDVGTPQPLVLDGEFVTLQTATMINGTLRAAGESVYIPFDVIYDEEIDFRNRPVAERIERVTSIATILENATKQSVAPIVMKRQLKIEKFGSNLKKRVGELTDVPEGFEKIPTDGYVITSVANNKSYKIKPPAMLTVDLAIFKRYDHKQLVFDDATKKLTAAAHNSTAILAYQGEPFYRKQRKAKSCPFPLFDVIVQDDNKTIFSNKGVISGPQDYLETINDGDLLELRVSPENDEMTIVRRRTDRLYPNSAKTVKGVLENLNFNLDSYLKTGKYTLAKPELVEGEDAIRAFPLDPPGTGAFEGGNKLKRDILEYIPVKTLLDIGSGDGADVSKWVSLPYKQIYACDVNDMSELLTRWKTKNTNIKLTCFRQSGDEPFKGIPPRSVDLVTLFFSIHFFFSSKEKLDRLFANIQKLLSPKGYVAILFIDGSRIPHESFTIGSFFSVERKSVCNDFGDEMTVNVVSPGGIVSNQKEWAVYPDLLTSSAEEHGMGLVEKYDINPYKYYIPRGDEAAFTAIHSLRIYGMKRKGVEYKTESSADTEGKKKLTDDEVGEAGGGEADGDGDHLYILLKTHIRNDTVTRALILEANTDKNSISNALRKDNSEIDVDKLFEDGSIKIDGFDEVVKYTLVSLDATDVEDQNYIAVTAKDDVELSMFESKDEAVESVNELLKEGSVAYCIYSVNSHKVLKSVAISNHEEALAPKYILARRDTARVEVLGIVKSKDEALKILKGVATVNEATHLVSELYSSTVLTSAKCKSTISDYTYSLHLIHELMNFVIVYDDKVLFKRELGECEKMVKKLKTPYAVFDIAKREVVSESVVEDTDVYSFNNHIAEPSEEFDDIVFIPMNKIREQASKQVNEIIKKLDTTLPTYMVYNNSGLEYDASVWLISQFIGRINKALGRSNSVKLVSRLELSTDTKCNIVILTDVLDDTAAVESIKELGRGMANVYYAVAFTTREVDKALTKIVRDNLIVPNPSVEKYIKRGKYVTDYKSTVEEIDIAPNYDEIYSALDEIKHEHQRAYWAVMYFQLVFRLGRKVSVEGLPDSADRMRNHYLSALESSRTNKKVLADGLLVWPYSGEFMTRPEIDEVEEIAHTRTLYTKIDTVHRHKAEKTLRYRKRALNHCNMHIGQRKLMLSEVMLLARYGHLSDTVVYAGSACGEHIPLLSKLFPKHKFILWDPAPFVKELYGLPAIEIHTGEPEGYFTDDAAAKYAGKNVIFISDIRAIDSNKKFATEEENNADIEATVRADMDAQRRWIHIMNPAASMLKFRLNYAAGKTNYLVGDIAQQPWRPNSSTEGRQIVLQKDNYSSVEYDNTTYEQECYYFNAIQREWAFYDHPYIDAGVGIDHCYDCALEARIWEEYMDYAAEHLGVYIPDETEFVKKMFSKVSKIIRRSLNTPPHNIEPEEFMVSKREAIQARYGNEVARKREAKIAKRARVDK